MAFDDIANNSENPFPGKIFNKPNGEDVYKGCNIDYSGSDVTPSNFLSIIQGDHTKVKGGNGKVLKSNKNSKVFINFADHGAPGLIAFPSEYLYATDFNSAINYMHTNEMYEKMVIYIEACESGSMFDGILANDINVYATTAANPGESSYAAYCYPDEKVNGTHINSCLGDLYSVNWMEDTEASDITSENFITQFTRVQTATSESHVMEYGETDFKNLPIGEFEGDYDKASTFFNRLMRKAVLTSDAPKDPKKHISSISSRDAELHHLYAKTMTQPTHRSHIDMSSEINDRMRADHVFEDFAGTIDDSQTFPAPKNFECLKSMINIYE